MEIRHKIDGRLRYCVSDFGLCRQQQASIKNVDCAGMAVCDCGAITSIYCFLRACRKIMSEQFRIRGGQTTFVGTGIYQAYRIKRPAGIGIIYSHKQPGSRRRVGIGGLEERKIANGHFNTPE